MIRLLPLFALCAAAIVLVSCGGDEEVVAVDRLKCEALASKDSHHFTSRTSFEVTDTGSGGPDEPADLVPFSVSWEVDADVTDQGARKQGTVKTSDGGSITEKEIIEVGSDAWTTLGPDSDFIKLQGVDGADPFPPDETCQALIEDIDLASLTGIQESVNGIGSLKYEIEGLPSAALADVPSIGGSADAVTVIDEYNGAIWVSSDGYISKLELAGSGEYEGGRRAINVNLSFEYSNINGVDTDIVAPIPLNPQ
jgi:hypothetical protein